MRRVAACLLLSATILLGTPAMRAAGPQSSNSRAARKAAKKQQKTMRKYLKAQKKAQKKALKKARRDAKKHGATNR